MKDFGFKWQLLSRFDPSVTNKQENYASLMNKSRTLANIILLDTSISRLVTDS